MVTRRFNLFLPPIPRSLLWTRAFDGRITNDRWVRTLSERFSPCPVPSQGRILSGILALDFKSQKCQSA